jgi:hypothetical protein
MVLQGYTAFGVGAITWEFMEFRTGYIGAPLVVEEVAVHGYHSI